MRQIKLCLGKLWELRMQKRRDKKQTDQKGRKGEMGTAWVLDTVQALTVPFQTLFLNTKEWDTCWMYTDWHCYMWTLTSLEHLSVTFDAEFNIYLLLVLLKNLVFLQNKARNHLCLPFWVVIFFNWSSSTWKEGEERKVQLEILKPLMNLFSREKKITNSWIFPAYLPTKSNGSLRAVVF